MKMAANYAIASEYYMEMSLVYNLALDYFYLISNRGSSLLLFPMQC